MNSKKKDFPVPLTEIYITSKSTSTWYIAYILNNSRSRRKLQTPNSIGMQIIFTLFRVRWGANGRCNFLLWSGLCVYQYSAYVGVVCYTHKNGEQQFYWNPKSEKPPEYAGNKKVWLHCSLYLFYMYLLVLYECLLLLCLLLLN